MKHEKPIDDSPAMANQGKLKKLLMISEFLLIISDRALLPSPLKSVEPDPTVAPDFGIIPSISGAQD